MQLESASGLLRRLEQRQRSRENEPEKHIELRRFAGPVHYLEHIDHLRIAHVTDIHVGRMTPMWVQRAAVRLVNEQNPDLVVVTGDFVAHSLEYLDQLAEVMCGYAAPTVAVLGNHDHWAGADEVRTALRRANTEVLDNVNTVITLRRQRLQLVGLDDAYTGHADPERALKGMRKDLPTLGLSHIAEEADRLWHSHVPLVLSGHTHGGQITLARLHELMVGRVAGHRYVHGLYGDRVGGAAPGAVYVGAGIGSSVMPIRVGDRGRREVTMFELGHLPGSFAEHHGEQTPHKGRQPSERLQEKRSMAVLKKKARRERKAGRIFKRHRN